MANQDAYLGMTLLPFLLAFGGAFLVGCVTVVLGWVVLPRLSAVVCWLCAAVILWFGATVDIFLVAGLAAIVMGVCFWICSVKPRSKS
jgi:hypothetical protein